MNTNCLWATRDGLVRLFDLAKGEESKEILPGHLGAARGIAFSADGRLKRQIGLGQD